jgi:hypothetical protein
MEQWCDRQVYWKVRSWSQTCSSPFASGCPWDATQHVLCIMADGMDQAKFKIPRSRREKVKAMDKFLRPALHVGGVLAHGFGLHLGVSAPDVPKDTNTNVEMLSRMLDCVLSQRSPLPQHLWLQQDNCPRECKNQKFFRWCIALVLRSWRSTNKLTSTSTSIRGGDPTTSHGD